ncbi:hypothetical protein NP233_g375 [Leucocoprinus birnbaumii]|uniref:Uncharacterized protein n=1 Tax=Leucocoprinus birnbaumii TaxID=56174 RepID=A0AAD5W6W4_9AGAR|nr:hypothetical protein NP233_g375 [Leucocoprinus birnbaumii]
MGATIQTGPLPSLVANLGMVYVANTFYGAFLVLFFLSTLVLHHQSLKNKRRSSGSFGTIVYLTLGYILCILITVHWLLSWLMYSHPDYVTRGYMPLSPLHPQPSVILFVQTLVGNVAIFVADLILMYRLYVIWNQSRVMLWLGSIMAMIDIVLIIPYISYFIKHRECWNKGAVIFPFVNLGTTITTTALITYKIWTQSRLTRALGDEKIIYKIIRIIVESAALETLPATAGIATSLVNVRVGLGWAAGEEGRSVQTFAHSTMNAPNLEDGRSSFIE